ncbi:MAG: hypothetical protein U1E76_00495 [Planctomycetota bacterium]
MTAVDFCFSQRGLFLIPVDELGPAGMSETFALELCARTDLTDAWVELFDAAFAAYWARASTLAARAPRHWWPPRVQHVAVVTSPAHVRPYFQPLHRTSWLVYASDFDPQPSHREFAAYQLLQVERMGLLQQVVPALAHNLSYFLLRSADEIAAFVAACERSPRPDATAYQALARAMPWVVTLHHETLRPPPAPAAGQRRHAAGHRLDRAALTAA